MAVYGQDAEVDLLERFLTLLPVRSVIDVGAEQGSFVAAMLAAGAGEIHAIEPEPHNIEHLRQRFRGNASVTVHACAISNRDGELELHLSTDGSGGALPFGHTSLTRPSTNEIAWNETISVRSRSLASLVASGQIPNRVGILKVDTEGHDLNVLVGLGELDCDVIMTEHWIDLPSSLGPCPWTTAEMVAAVSARGFSHFAFVVHRGECTFVQWQDGRVPIDGYGNLVFVHDRVLARLFSRDTGERLENSAGRR